MPDIDPILWETGGRRPRLLLLDQTLLPHRIHRFPVEDLACALDAIRTLKVRGAPLLGIFGVVALSLGLRQSTANDSAPLATALRISNLVRETRPTAVNLGSELDRFLADAEAMEWESVEALADCALAYAQRLADSDRLACEKIALHGSPFITDGMTVATHCNAGSLATGGIGTALGILKQARRSGRRFRVLVPETRPLLQGARLTALELQLEGIPHEIITEGALGYAYSSLGVDLTVVGADRIAANGDTANKVGTLVHAVLAARYGASLVVAAPLSTFDRSALSGRDIPIETRSGEEVVNLYGTATAPTGTKAVNPAFDVTPASLISAIVTDAGVLRPPYPEAISSLPR